ncbi:LRMP protein, partial [Polyodon spathula]|nr:LRMP protein [Polyodon spathula]
QSAFTHLSLAFKCDQYTLRKRLQAEERAREVTEENVHRELEEGRATLQTLKALCLDSKRNEIIQQLEQSLEILANTIKRIASTAELLGAVHQEARVSHAVELMILHVENLKQHHVQELSELEEMKRLVQRNSRTRKFSEPQDESDMRQKLQHLRSTQQVIQRRLGHMWGVFASAVIQFQNEKALAGKQRRLVPRMLQINNSQGFINSSI